jgi:photosystem II stability/assembly factor-like uncharacterized protein
VDGGDHWNKSNSDLMFESVIDLAVDPSRPSTLYAGTGFTGIYKSINKGEKWVNSSRGLPELSSISGITFDPSSPSTIYVINEYYYGEYGVYKTIDGGETWNLIDNGIRYSHVSEIAINPLSPATLYVGTEDGMFKTIDGGNHWVSCNTGLPTNSDFYSLAIDPENTNVVYTGTYNKGLYKTDDGGDHWFPINNGLPATFWTSDLVFDPSDSSTVYAGTYNGVYRSVNGGSKWSLTGNGLEQSDVLNIILDPSNPFILYAATRKGLYKSLNKGDEWFLSTIGISTNNVISFSVDPSDPQILYAGTVRMGLFRSLDNGKTWDSMDIGFPNSEIRKIIVDPQNSDTIYIALRTHYLYKESSLGVFKSLDKGATWKPINAGLGSKMAVTDMAIDPINPSTLYLVQYDEGIYKTTNGGLFWNKLTFDVTAPSDCANLGLSQITIDPIDTSSLYILSNGCGIYKSTDGGGHWENFLVRGNTWFYTLFIDPSTSFIYVVVGDDIYKDIIYKSDNGGTSWYISHYDLPVNTISYVLLTDPETPTTLYLGSEEGIFKSVNNGDWISMGKISVFVNTLFITRSTPPVLYAGTSSGVYSLPLVN